MSFKENNALFDKHGVRIAAMLYIPAISFDDVFPELFTEDFVFNLPAQEHVAKDPLIAALPALRPLVEGDLSIHDDDVFQVFYDNDIDGFLVKCETPEYDFDDDGDPHPSGGSTWFAWLYASTMDEVATVAIAWAETRHAEDAESARKLRERRRTPPEPLPPELSA